MVENSRQMKKCHKQILIYATVVGGDIFRLRSTPVLDVRKFKRVMRVLVDDGMTL